MGWWLAGLGVAAAAFFAALAAYGWTRPPGHTATVSTRVAAARSRVWAVLTDDAAHPEWRDGLSNRSRDGDTITETDDGGDVLRLAIEAEVVGERRVLRVLDARGFSGSWTVELADEGDGTRVTVTERGEVHNVVFRVLAPWFHDPDATARRFLEDLAKRLASGEGGDSGQRLGDG